MTDLVPWIPAIVALAALVIYEVFSHRARRDPTPVEVLSVTSELLRALEKRERRVWLRHELRQLREHAERVHQAYLDSERS